VVVTLNKKILFFVLIPLLISTIPTLPTRNSTSVQGQVSKKEKLVQEVATVYPQSDYWPLALAPWYIPEGAYDVLVNGTVNELKNRSFDFYSFNKLNYERWKANASYQTYVNAKNVTTYSFSFSPTRQDVVEGLRLVVSNIYAQEVKNQSLVDTTVTIYQFMPHSSWFSIPPFMMGYSAELTVRGTAKEIHNYRFNLYVFDSKNYNLYNTNRTYVAFYEAKNRDTYSFSFTIPREKSAEPLYFIVERVEPNVRLDIDLSASGSWLAPATLSVEYDVTISWKENPDLTTTTPPPTTPSPRQGCVIATAAYNSPLAPEVTYMRHVRDDLIGSTKIGRVLVDRWNNFYYLWSPTLAGLIVNSESLQATFKILLLPLVGVIHMTALTYDLAAQVSVELASFVAFTVASILAILTYIVTPILVVARLTKRIRAKWLIQQIAKIEGE